MSALVTTLRARIDYLTRESEQLAGAIDALSQKYADALTLLRAYEPAYVAEALGEVAPVEAGAEEADTESDAAMSRAERRRAERAARHAGNQPQT